MMITNFNPRSSYEERQLKSYCCFCNPISIHAPHTKSDLARSPTRIEVFISIHAPHTKSDLQMEVAKRDKKFQSTLLIRRATIFQFSELLFGYFNPRSSYEERRYSDVAEFHRFISIHAPHTKSDILGTISWLIFSFQSTLLIRRAT